MGGVTSECCKCFQHQFLENHCLRTSHSKRLVVSKFCLCSIFLCSTKSLFFQPSSLLGNLSIIHFLEGMCQGYLFIRLLFTLAHFCALCYYVGFFHLVCYWQHSHHWFGFYCLSCFLPFYFLIDFCGAHGSTQQVFDLVASRLFFNFSPPTNFCYHLDDIRVLGIPFGSIFSTSSFLQNTTLDKDVCYVNALPKLRDVQITFGVFF